MYRPQYRENREYVPILSRKEIEDIAERYVCDFQPAVIRDCVPLDIESFIECYLGMNQDYQYLSHNGIYLGMTVFNDTDKVPVYDPRTNRAEYVHVDANTVIIDRWLYEDENQKHRYRFTLGHEGGHGIFHTKHFYRDPNQMSFLETDDAPVIRCRKDMERTKPNPRLWTDQDRMEWQANAFASSLLMPRTAVRNLFRTYDHCGRTEQVCCAIKDIVNNLDVSQSAAVYRLKDLGLLAQEDVEKFLPGSAFLDFMDFAI